MYTEERNRKISIALKGDKSPTWNGGTSFEEYGIGFTGSRKKKIRKLYGYKCFECGREEEVLGCKLSTHHIDYDKKNNDELNFVPLCNSCHAKTNFEREEWRIYFKDKQNMFFKEI